MTTQSRFPLQYSASDSPPSVSRVNKPISLREELRNRHMACYFILSIGRRARLSSRTISTAIVTLHRFYMHRCFQDFNRSPVSLACLYLSSKIENERLTFERLYDAINSKSANYLQVKDLVFNLEEIVLMTIGFTISTPNLSVLIIDICRMIRMDANFIHHCYRVLHLNLVMTTFCLRYKPEVIACLVVHVTLKWAGYVPPISTENKFWYTYVDPSMSLSFLDSLTVSFFETVKDGHAYLSSRKTTFRPKKLSFSTSC